MIIGPPDSPEKADQEDRGLRQQNEHSCGGNPKKDLQVCRGFNDSGGIYHSLIADAHQGFGCARDGGKTWNSELVPGPG